jgi:hypothetical protein
MSATHSEAQKQQYRRLPMENEMYTVQEYVGNKWFTIARFATETEAANFAKKHRKASFDRIIAK